MCKVTRVGENCDQVSKEQDPKKLVTLVEEINRLLDAKGHRLEDSPPLEPQQIAEATDSTLDGVVGGVIESNPPSKTVGVEKNTIAEK